MAMQLIVVSVDIPEDCTEVSSVHDAFGTLTENDPDGISWEIVGGPYDEPYEIGEDIENIATNTETYMRP